MKGNSSVLRKGRFTERGRIYLVTFVTDKRSPLFHNFSLARLVVKSMNHPSLGCKTLCFVVMPDHVHWLVQLQSRTLHDVVHSVKSYTSNQINNFRGERGKVWQDGFHDHALRSDEDLQDVARYVILNPVRAGLVKSVKDYPHWDAVWIE